MKCIDLENYSLLKQPVPGEIDRSTELRMSHGLVVDDMRASLPDRLDEEKIPLSSLSSWIKADEIVLPENSTMLW